MDVASGEVITRGLSMPHSPLWYAGRLWVCESGAGTLGHRQAQLGGGHFMGPAGEVLESLEQTGQPGHTPRPFCRCSGTQVAYLATGDSRREASVFQSISKEHLVEAISQLPILVGAIQYSIVYMLLGGGLFGAIVVYVVAKGLGK